MPNALHVLAWIVSGLHDAEGRIAVPGFYNGVAEPSEDKRAAIAAIPLDEAALYRALDTAPAGEAGYTLLERLWLRPTLEVNGMWGGYTGPGSKTVIPNEARAKLTTRLVIGQDPERVRRALIAHLEAVCPSGARLEIAAERGWAGAYSVPAEHPLLLAAEDALEETSGTRPVRVRIGASLPLTDIVEHALGIDTVMLSFAVADEDYHAPNEFFRLASIDEGLAAWTALFRRLGGHRAGDYAAFRRTRPGRRPKTPPRIGAHGDMVQPDSAAPARVLPSSGRMLASAGQRRRDGDERPGAATAGKLALAGRALA